MGPISRAPLRKRPRDHCLASNFSLSTLMLCGLRRVVKNPG